MRPDWFPVADRASVVPARLTVRYDSEDVDMDGVDAGVGASRAQVYTLRQFLGGVGAESFAGVIAGARDDACFETALPGGRAPRTKDEFLAGCFGQMAQAHDFDGLVEALREQPNRGSSIPQRHTALGTAVSTTARDADVEKRMASRPLLLGSMAMPEHESGTLLAH